MSRLLVVVDMQKDFVDGALGSPEARAIVPDVLDKVKAYRDAGDEVVFTLDTHFDDYMDTMEGKKLPVVHCVKGTPGWELVPELREVPGTRFEKHTFGSRELADYAAVGRYDFVELVGLCTDICVISNAMLIKAAVPDTSIQVDGACCAGVTPVPFHSMELHCWGSERTSSPSGVYTSVTLLWDRKISPSSDTAAKSGLTS